MIMATATTKISHNIIAELRSSDVSQSLETFQHCLLEAMIPKVNKYFILEKIMES
mgnify:CR=1 FL=1